MLMAAGEVNGSVICATIQKEERVCCPSTNENESAVGFSNEVGQKNKNKKKISFKACGYGTCIRKETSYMDGSMFYCPYLVEMRRVYAKDKETANIRLVLGEEHDAVMKKII
jgi:hypothetical protein